MTIRKEFDPNNLSAGDVARGLAAPIGIIVALIVVGKYAPRFIWLLVVGIPVCVYFYISRMPKEDLRAIADAEHRANEKIRNLPIVGPILYPLLRVLDWAHSVFIIVFLLLLAFWLFAKYS